MCLLVSLRCVHSYTRNHDTLTTRLLVLRTVLFIRNTDGSTMNSHFVRRLTVPAIFFMFGFVTFPLISKLYGSPTVPLSRDQAEESRKSIINQQTYNPSGLSLLQKENVSTRDESLSSWIDSQLLKTHLNIPYAEEIPNQTNVFKWTGSQWVRLANFCTWSDFNRCSMLKTNNGETPIFHHEAKNDYTSELLERYGAREPESVNAILDYLGNDFSITFVDVGSHVGSIALQMAKVGYRIVTADPLPENIGRLCKSVQTGNFVNNATVLFTPVSSDHKSVSFIRKWNIGETKVKTVFSWDQTHDTAAPSCKLPPLFSKSATLDDIMPFIKTHKVFLKIDVESHEYFVIAGGKELFKQRFVVGIFMEWLHVKNTPEAEELITLLNELGFKAYSLGKESIALIYANYMDWPFDIIWKRVIY